MVLYAAEGLVCAEVGDDVADEAFDRGELPAPRRNGEFKLGNDDAACVGLDNLAVKILPRENADGVHRTFGCAQPAFRT